MRRFRLLRKDCRTRDQNAQVQLNITDFIYPYFVVEGEGIQKEISSLRNVFHFSIDQLLLDVKEVQKLGVNKIIIFGVPPQHKKCSHAVYSYEDDSIVPQAVKDIKKNFPEMLVITDVCICAYTDHGHCGLIGPDRETILNDESLEILAKIAVCHARAGADFVAPSAMMDGQVESIRQELIKNNFVSTKILSYSAKYASNYYGPFRDAAESAPSFGDRATYQMDCRTIGQGVDEVSVDLQEGANWVMVKPAHTYLDMIVRIRFQFPKCILVAYQVSGEYMMIHASAEQGYCDRDKAMLEAFYAMKRAGANFIISYGAKEYAKKIKENL